MASPHRQPGSIMFVITSNGAWWGGAERQVHHLARTFRGRGWQVAIVTMLPTDDSMRALEAEGVDVWSLGMRRTIPDPRALLRLHRLLRAYRPDVLHSHMVHANLLARLVGSYAKVPVIVSTIHNEDEGAQWRYLAYRLTDRLAGRTTAVSQRAANVATRRGAAPRGRIIRVVNGIDTEPYRDNPAERVASRDALGIGTEFVWIAVGRLVEAKSYPAMLEAFALATADGRQARLLIAGVGPLREQIEDSIREHQLGDSVSLLGLRSDVPALMQAADGFVLSSAWEGLPMVLLEAAASALPIVATDVGGSDEVVLDGESGYVVPPENVVALAQAMRRTMALPVEERLEMGRAGRAHVSKAFELNGVVDRWEEIYHQVRDAR